MAAIHIQTATRVVPQCYAYTLPDVPSLAGMTKIGFTERNVDTRTGSGRSRATQWSRRARYKSYTLWEPIGVLQTPTL